MKMLLVSAFVAGGVVSANATSAATCESLRGVSVPHVTITGAEVVAPGPFRPPAPVTGANPPAGIRLPSHCRVFMAPGMPHCGAGDGPNQFNPMAPLERWRESNVPPDEIIAAHVTGDVVDTIQPLCPYPQLAAYRGSGSPGDAANYSCRVP